MDKGKSRGEENMVIYKTIPFHIWNIWNRESGNIQRDMY